MSIPVILCSVGIFYAINCLMLGDPLGAIKTCAGLIIYLHVREWFVPKSKKKDP